MHLSQETVTLEMLMLRPLQQEKKAHAADHDKRQAAYHEIQKAVTPPAQSRAFCSASGALPSPVGNLETTLIALDQSHTRSPPARSSEQLFGPERSPHDPNIHRLVLRHGFGLI